MHEDISVDTSKLVSSTLKNLSILFDRIISVKLNQKYHSLHFSRLELTGKEQSLHLVRSKSGINGKRNLNLNLYLQVPGSGIIQRNILDM